MYRFDPLKANFEDQLTAGGFTGTSAEMILGNNFTKTPLILMQEFYIQDLLPIIIYFI